MLAVFDRQHHGKPNRNDYGAAADIDGDGVIEVWERESELTPLYINSAKKTIQSAGHTAMVEDEGWYSSRHERANINAKSVDGPVAYVACHLNAGGGDYCAVFYDYRSKNGRRLAEMVGSAVGELHIPSIGRVVIRAANPDDWTRNAYYTIKGLYAGPANISGICFEPLFMDNPEHQRLIAADGLQWIGTALATGIMRWGLGRTATV